MDSPIQNLPRKLWLDDRRFVQRAQHVQKAFHITTKNANDNLPPLEISMDAYNINTCPASSERVLQESWIDAKWLTQARQR